MLNWIWAAFFLIAFIVAVWQAVVGGKPDAMGAVVAALFDSSKTAFELSLGLTGVMSLWLGS
jgi:spore maturation protein SpmA